MPEIDLHFITIAGFIVVTFVFAIVFSLAWRMFKNFSEKVMDSNRRLQEQNKRMRNKMDLVISYRIGKDISSKLKADIVELTPLMVAIVNEEKSVDDVKNMLSQLVEVHTKKKKVVEKDSE